MKSNSEVYEIGFSNHHSNPSQGWVNEMKAKKSYKVMYLIPMTSKWAQWRLKSPASRLFTQPFMQTQVKENIKAPRHWPLCGEFTGDRWIPRTNGQ